MVSLPALLQVVSQLSETTDTQSLRKSFSVKMVGSPQTHLICNRSMGLNFSSFTHISRPISFNMISFHYYYFFVTCFQFVKLGYALPPSFDKKDILESAAHPHSGSSDTIVGSENQYLEVSTTVIPIVVIARSNWGNLIATRLLLSHMESRHSGVLEPDRDAPGLPKHSKRFNSGGRTTWPFIKLQ